MNAPTWEDTLKAWLDAGSPSGASADSYRRWTAERFGLDPQRQLHLQEKWALDDLSIGATQRGAAGPGATARVTSRPMGVYGTADGSVRAELLQVEGPGGATLHPRARLVQPELPSLNRLLAASNALRLKGLLDHVMDGRPYEHRPLPGEARLDPTAWLLDPWPRREEDIFKIWEIGSDRIETGSRRALLLALELQVQANLALWDGKPSDAPGLPPWVPMVRERHVRLLAALNRERLVPAS